MKKDIIVGSLEDFTGQSVKKICEICGNECYFHDKWDFKKFKIICIECAMELKDEEEYEFQVNEQTVKNFAELKGIDEWEANILIREIMDRGNLGENENKRF
jgi:hypothetical protein